MFGRLAAVPITTPRISPIAQPVRQCSAATAAVLEGTRGGGPPAAADASLAVLAVISLMGTAVVNTAMMQAGWHCRDGQVAPRPPAMTAMEDAPRLRGRCTPWPPRPGRRPQQGGPRKLPRHVCQVSDCRLPS